MNISKKTVISNMPEGITVPHLQACLGTKGLHEKTEYSYFGKRVSRGTIVLHTKKGNWKIKFTEKDGWLKTIEFLQ